MRENYSVNTFDYSYLNPGYFVSGLNDGKTDYQLGACANACKRCYSAASNNCYECQQGYALYGKTCKTVTGYYLKTPSNNNAVKSLKLVTQMLDPAFDIKTRSPLTITIWMKFFGITLEAQNKDFYPIIYFYGTDSFSGLAASLMMSSTETIFYTMSVYFMAAHVTKTRYTLVGALIATLAGTVASFIFAGMMAGGV